MIKFNCTNCNKKIGVPDEYAGKKIGCPGCEKVLVVPSTEQESRLLQTYDCRAPNKPQKIAFGFIGVACLGLLILILWAFVLRDTWEIDNWDKISQMSDSVQQLIWNNKLEEGVAKYDELLAFIGDRELKQDALHKDLQEAEESAEPTRKTIHAADTIVRNIVSLEEKAKSCIVENKFTNAINIYQQALSLADGIDHNLSHYMIAVTQLNQELLNSIKELKHRVVSLEKKGQQFASEKNFKAVVENYQQAINSISGIDNDKWNFSSVSARINQELSGVLEEVRDCVTSLDQKGDYFASRRDFQHAIKSYREAINVIFGMNEEYGFTPMVKQLSQKADDAKIRFAMKEKQEREYRIQQEKARQEALVKQQYNEQRRKNLPHLVVQNILNKSSVFRNAKFTGTTSMSGDEVSYNYEVEYLTGAGLVRIGKFNVAIVNGECREVYFNGAEIWTQIMDPRLKGYRNP